MMTRILALAVTTALALAACGWLPTDASDALEAERTPDTPTHTPAEQPGDQPDPTSPPVDGDDARPAWCDMADPMLARVERPFIGSDDHVQQFYDLAAVAPEHYVDGLHTLAEFYDNDVSPANPDSQDFVNFPPHIQDLALELDSGLREDCP